MVIRFPRPCSECFSVQEQALLGSSEFHFPGHHELKVKQSAPIWHWVILALPQREFRVRSCKVRLASVNWNLKPKRNKRSGWAR